MTRRIFLYLHSMELSQASWVILDGDDIEKSVLREHLSELSFEDRQHETVVVVPATDVLLTDVLLPKLNRERLLKALPFALEEQLIDDVHDLHFAAGDVEADGKVPTAIVSRKKMDEWMALLRQYDIVPTTVCSAVFALPRVEKAWSSSIFQDAATVRQGIFQGFGGDSTNLPVLIELAMTAAVEKPECLHVYNTLTKPLAIQPGSVVINEIHWSELDWLETFPTWLDSTAVINLLQGPYQPKRKTSEIKKIWLFASVATLAFIGVTFFFELFSFFILHHEMNVTEAKIERIYKHNFPEAKSVVSPRERLQEKLSALEERANTNYFLILLAKVSVPLSQTHAVQLKNLDYRENGLTLELTANTVDDLDNLARTLTQNGLTVKQENAAVAGQAVKASFIITRSGL
ncbi:MAG TPA: type II secretion system protein GspL [Gammaproteobacteria bacterium]|nr:type II secretion system protein GspL [Gammaproteobacteria bacterium]